MNQVSVKVNLTWNEGLKFEAQVQERKIQLNSAEQMNSAFTPMELFLFSLAGCTAMDVHWILDRQRQKINRFEIAAHAERREEDPRSFESIELEYYLKGNNIRKDAVERAIRLSQEKYCSVKAMLKDTVKMNITYRISNGANEERYVYNSTNQPIKKS